MHPRGHQQTSDNIGKLIDLGDFIAATGVPLRHIPEIRAPHERNRFEDVVAVAAGESEIDFAASTRVPPAGHRIAARTTAENAEAGFGPTPGGIRRYGAPWGGTRVAAEKSISDSPAATAATSLK